MTIVGALQWMWCSGFCHWACSVKMVWLWLWLDGDFGVQDAEGGSMKYKQRYFYCDKFWRRDANGKRGPIFVYIGNESDVEL